MNNYFGAYDWDYEYWWSNSSEVLSIDEIREFINDNTWLELEDTNDLV